MKQLCSVILILMLVIGGCKKIFLTDDSISSLTSPAAKNNLVIYYHTHYTITGDGRLFEKNHSLLKIGENLKAVPQFFYVFDGSVEKLTDFSAKIRQANGSVKTYNKGDLLTQRLSDRYRISELKARYLPIMTSIAVGDLIETVSTHELKLPPLGIRFSPSEIGEQAANISCTIEMPLQDSLSFKIANDTLSPKISYQAKSKLYRFEWNGYAPQSQRHSFTNRNNAPEILAAFPRFRDFSSKKMVRINDWKDFGNWYLDLIASKTAANEMIASLAQEITMGTTTAKEKMDAIFEYCQKNVRYEQVYLEKGEFIPNDYQTILARKYGDCKDYSLLMYVLAKSIGVNPNLALCYRGRGVKFYEDITVSQFNHAIVYLNDAGHDYWYDGTNRIGIPGVTTKDLMNATALILEKNNSRLTTIAESPGNKLQIEGAFNYNNKGLVGEIKISLFCQFAIDFFYEEMYL
ncbi:MAG TPA: transglutaminase domain-containing protein, partial [bacterium]